MSAPVLREIVGSVGVVQVDNPPVNALSPGVPEAILAAVTELARDDDVKAIVLAGAGRTFIAGADIRELQQMAAGEKTFDASLQQFLDQLEAIPKPLIAAIHGSALGGGLETAMACHYRIADRQAIVGQPEVDLGLIPGAAGTQRLPRLVGVVPAARMCALGRPLSAEEALRAELIDQVADGNLIDTAVTFANSVAASSWQDRRTSQIQDRLGDPEDHGPALEKLRDEVSAMRPGESAPLLAIEAVASAATLPYDAGCEQELRLFDECMTGPQAKAMIRAFFGARKAAMRLSPNASKELAPLDRLVVVHRHAKTQDVDFIGRELLEASDLLVETISLDETAAPLETLEHQAILLVPDIDDQQGVDQQLEQFQSQLASAQQLSGNAPVLVLLPDSRQPSEYLSQVPGASIVALAFSPCGGKTAEVYVGADVAESTIDRIVMMLKKLRLTGYRRNQLGTQAVSALYAALDQSVNELIKQGVSPAKIAKSLARAGFTCLPTTKSDRPSEPVKMTASKIVTSCVDRMIEVADRIQESNTFASELELDMLAIGSGLYPTYRGGPCWEKNARK